MNDQIFRHHYILEKLQNCRFSNPVSVPEIRDFLLDKGVNVGVRTIQRDMIVLKDVFFGIESHALRDGGYGWYWSDNAKVILLSGLSPNQALSFILVKKYLSQLFPETTLNELEPFFEHSDKVLNKLEGNALVKWPDKISVVHPSQPLMPPVINSEFQKIISTALLENKRLHLDYVRLDGEKIIYTLNPLGLIFRGNVIYLIATKVETSDVRMFALHRIVSAKQLKQDAMQPDGFNLATFVDEGHMGFAWNAWNIDTILQVIQFKVIFEEHCAKHLYETPLSTDQKIIEYIPGYVSITATVRYTEQLVWWIRGYGSFIEVLEPKELRERIKNEALKLVEKYK
jgi:predicted DNA-binding transcriptional regulator YafY